MIGKLEVLSLTPPGKLQVAEEQAGWQGSIAQNGFAIIPGVLTERAVSELIDVLTNAELPRSKAGIRHILSNASVAALARQSSLLNLAREVLGGEAVPFRATLFDKSPDANWLVTWHQDTALPLRERRELPGWGPWSLKSGRVYAHAPASALNQVLALRLHLDDSTAMNGPLRVLSGTHRSGVLSDDEVHQLATDISPIECLVSRGGVLAMRPLLVHASSKSQVDAPRRVLHIEYAASMKMEGGLELALA